MINIKYDRLQNETIIELEKFSCLMASDLPLTVEFRKMIDGYLAWTCELYPGSWSSWRGAEVPYNITVKKADGSIFFEKKFDVELQGNIIEKTLWHFIMNLPNRAKGLVIGSHDGTFGHWVYPVINGLTDVTLVDGSSAQFSYAKKNYGHLSSVNFIEQIITTDGSDVEWYEGGDGFTDTIYKPVINIFLEDDKVTKTHRSSISINDLVDQVGGNLDWLHLDVEGIDDDLILALKCRPTVIIYETMHLNNNKKFALLDWFQENEYNLLEFDGNAMAIKKEY